MIQWLTSKLEFPDVHREDVGDVVAVGGDLSAERVMLAYRSGIFPWILDGKTIEWWCPDPRFVLFPEQFRVTKSLARIIKSGKFSVTFDCDFRAVIENCRSIQRPGQPGSWITDTVVKVFCELHEAGHAHSVEVWLNKELVGGL
jgi:leucyl/phenylalanyl-tRNA--protein transferase